MLNTDYKMLAQVIANRIKRVIEMVVGLQYTKGHSRHNQQYKRHNRIHEER